MALTNRSGLLLISLCLVLGAGVSGRTPTKAPPADARTQTAAPGASTPSASVALAPARFQLEMSPGTETTVVVNLVHRSPDAGAQPFRVIASLNDWDISPDGQVEFHKANSRPNSASSWMVYSPTEVAVQPGRTHSIRVTIAVPKDATPGDHLAALIVEATSQCGDRCTRSSRC